MKDSTPSSERPAGERGEQAQPWHAADERPAGKTAARPGGAPLGTHSLTGSGAAVGMPSSPRADDAAGRGAPQRTPEEAGAPAQPRDLADILGRKP